MVIVASAVRVWASLIMYSGDSSSLPVIIFEEKLFQQSAGSFSHIRGKWDIWLIPKWIHDRYVWGDRFILRSELILILQIPSLRLRGWCAEWIWRELSQHTGWPGSLSSKYPSRLLFQIVWLSECSFHTKCFIYPISGLVRALWPFLSWILFYILTWFCIKAMCLYCHYISVKSIFKLVLNVFPILSVIFNCCNIYHHLVPRFLYSGSQKLENKPS